MKLKIAFYCVVVFVQALSFAFANETAQLPQCVEMKPEDSNKVNMVAQLLEAKKPYAALAFIKTINIDTPQLSLLKANSLRQVGRAEAAEAAYASLIESCVGALAYQGLGLIQHKRGNYQESLRYLKMAAQYDPINSTIRNDYGYALMLTNDYKSSLNEYLTAIELDERNTLAKSNLISLLYKTNQVDEADKLRKLYNLPVKRVQKESTVKESYKNNMPTNKVASSNSLKGLERTLDTKTISTELKGESL